MDLELTDLLLAAVIVLGAWGGWRRGLLQAAFELVTLTLSMIVAFVFYAAPVGWLQGRWPGLDPWLAPLSFVLLFVLSLVASTALLHRIVGGAPGHVHRHPVNRALGIVPGLVNGVIHATLVAALLLSLPLTGTVAVLARTGPLGALLAQPAEWLEAQLTPIFDPALQRVLQAMTVPAGSRESTPLKFRVENAKPRPDLEARMLELVNAERAKEDLPPLKPDAELVDVAREHSQDMLARGYFAHVTPEGGDVGTRLRRHKVRFAVAGENLALAQTLPIAHNGLMHSPGHRANILRRQYNRVGIGVLDGGRHGLMITQVFRN